MSFIAIVAVADLPSLFTHVIATIIYRISMLIQVASFILGTLEPIP